MKFRAVELQSPDVMEFQKIGAGETYKVKKGEQLILKDSQGARRFSFLEDSIIEGPCEIFKEEIESNKKIVTLITFVSVMFIIIGLLMNLFSFIDPKLAILTSIIGVLIGIPPCAFLTIHHPKLAGKFGKIEHEITA